MKNYTQILTTAAKQTGLSIKDVTPYGDYNDNQGNRHANFCFYCSVADQLESLKIVKQDGKSFTPLELKEYALDYVRKYGPKHLAPTGSFIELNGQNLEGETHQKQSELFIAHHTGDVFADDVIKISLSRALGINIATVFPEQDNSKLSQPSLGNPHGEPVLIVAYNGHNHYTSTLPDATQPNKCKAFYTNLKSQIERERKSSEPLAINSQDKIKWKYDRTPAIAKDSKPELTSYFINKQTELLDSIKICTNQTGKIELEDDKQTFILLMNQLLNPQGEKNPLLNKAINENLPQLIENINKNPKNDEHLSKAMGEFYIKCIENIDKATRPTKTLSEQLTETFFNKQTELLESVTEFAEVKTGKIGKDDELAFLVAVNQILNPQDSRELSDIMNQNLPELVKNINNTPKNNREILSSCFQEFYIKCIENISDPEKSPQILENFSEKQVPIIHELIKKSTNPETGKIEQKELSQNLNKTLNPQNNKAIKGFIDKESSRLISEVNPSPKDEDSIFQTIKKFLNRCIDFIMESIGYGKSINLHTSTKEHIQPKHNQQHQNLRKKQILTF